jgi:hypothetical protein
MDVLCGPSAKARFSQPTQTRVPIAEYIYKVNKPNWTWNRHQAGTGLTPIRHQNKVLYLTIMPAAQRMSLVHLCDILLSSVYSRDWQHGCNHDRPHRVLPGTVAHEIDTAEDSLSDSPPVILSACFPRSPVRILITSETGITGEMKTHPCGIKSLSTK